MSVSRAHRPLHSFPTRRSSDLIAEHLAAHAQVVVLTTCARDYVTWHDDYPAGAQTVNGIPIQRFPVDRERDVKDRKSTRLNSSHRCISYAVFCLKKKKNKIIASPPGSPHHTASAATHLPPGHFLTTAPLPTTPLRSSRSLHIPLTTLLLHLSTEH